MPPGTQSCRQNPNKGSAYNEVNFTASALHHYIMHTYYRQKMYFQITYEKIALLIFFQASFLKTLF